MRPGFSMMNKRPEPSGAKSTGRSRPEAICCHMNPFGSGKVVALGSGTGVSVEGICVEVDVAGRAVGGALVAGTEADVGVGGSGVLNPLHASRGNTNKRIKRFISYLSFTSVVSASTTSPLSPLSRLLVSSASRRAKRS